jgi:hypothetical protein
MIIYLYAYVYVYLLQCPTSHCDPKTRCVDSRKTRFVPRFWGGFPVGTQQSTVTSACPWSGVLWVKPSQLSEAFASALAKMVGKLGRLGSRIQGLACFVRSVTIQRRRKCESRRAVSGWMRVLFALNVRRRACASVVFADSHKNVTLVEDKEC